MLEVLLTIIAIASIVLVFSLWGMWCEYKEKKEWEAENPGNDPGCTCGGFMDGHWSDCALNEEV